MADPLSVTSALIAIVTATVQSSQALYETVKSFRNHQRTVGQLMRELRGLSKVLESLQVHVQTDETAFLPLKFPLVQCCQACTEFQALIVKSSLRSSGGRTSFRDWARLRYMNGDVVEFTNMLAGYKATINITLGDANLRSSKVTLQVLNEYKDMIDDTRHDLENHLEEINLKLQSLVPQDRAPSTTTTPDIRRIENERDSTERCLEICTQLLEHISTMRFQPVAAQSSSERTPAAISAHDLTVADVITLSTLKSCSTKLSETMSELQAHREAANSKAPLDTTEPPHGLAADPDLSIQRLWGEVDSTKQRLELCERASAWASSGRVHTVEDITVGNDAKQMCVSTLGDLFNVKGATAGHGSFQFFGSTSEAGLKQLLEASNKRSSVHSDDQAVEELCTTGGSGSSAI